MKRIGSLIRLERPLEGNVDVGMANTFFERALGLLAHASLPRSEALWIVPCRSVHTWFMRFDIDVVFLSRESRVLGVAESVGPFRFAWAPRNTHSVLELAAGRCRELGIGTGDPLRIE